MKIGIIGVGNMGTALYKGLLKGLNQEDIYLCDSNIEHLKTLQNENLYTEAEKMIREVDVVILAVKPQIFPMLAEDVEITEQLIISIMAGVSLQNISDLLETENIIRTMPNLPIQVGKGVFGYIADESVSTDDVEWFGEGFQVFGELVELTVESQIDQLTLISGSGPAYFFYLTELLENKASEFGFSSEQAKILAEQTFIGSAATFASNNLTAEEFRKAVTSKGGTTEAAIDAMNKQSLPEIFSKALDAGVDRAKELNG